MVAPALPSPAVPGQRSLAFLRDFQIVSLWDMLQFNVAGLTECLRELRKIENDTSPPDRDKRLNARKVFQAAMGYAKTLDLTTAKREAEKAAERLRVGQFDTKLAAESARRLHDYIESELVSRLFMHVSPGKVQYYQEEQLFGKDVEERFPDKVPESIAEAGKCFAFGRYTACVYHLMCVLEVGVQELGDRLCGPGFNINRSWGKILKDVDRHVASMPMGTTAERNSQQKFAEIVGYLGTIKDAWRNSTMHPKNTYTEEEAKVIFDATRMFMQKLAATI